MIACGVRLTATVQPRYGIVILGPDFLKKEWLKELDGLVAREDGKEKVRYFPFGTMIC